MGNLKRLWKISKYTYEEVFIETQIKMAGATQSKLMEDLEKNKKYLKLQDITMKIVIVLYLAGLIVFPIQIFSKIDTALQQGMPIEWIISIGSLLMSLFFLSEFLIIITFGLMQASDLLSGKHFQWLMTLPFSKDEIQKITLLSFFRGVDSQIITMLFVLPIGIFISTKNVVIFLISIGFSICNVLFCFGCLVLLGEQLQRVMDSRNAPTTKNNFIRIGVILLYVVVLVVGGMGIQLSFIYIDSVFNATTINLELFHILNYILPFIAFPFSNGYLMVMLYIAPSYNFFYIFISSIIGCILFGFISYKVFKKSLSRLKKSLWAKTILRNEKSSSSTLEDVILKVDSPMKSFFNKDKKFATRDFQVAMMFIMPLILPLLSWLTVVLMQMDEEVDAIGLIITNFSMNFMYLIMSAVIIIYGLMSIESTGSTILGSLPVRERDQTNAKIRWLLVILCLASLIQILVFIDHPVFLPNFILTVITLPFGYILGVFSLELKVRMFGKLKYKYVLDNVQIKNKVWKWILIGIIDLIIYGLIFGVITALIVSKPTNYLLYSTLGMIIITIASGFIVNYIYNKMFPK